MTKKTVSNVMLEKQINELKEYIEKRLNKMDNKVEELDTDIRGKEGLNVRIGQAEINIENVHKKLAGIDSNVVWVLRLIIGTMIVAGMALLFAS